MQDRRRQLAERRRRTSVALARYSFDAFFAGTLQPPAAAAHADIILDIMLAMVSIVRLALAG
jgi:hypothetical protein